MSAHYLRKLQCNASALPAAGLVFALVAQLPNLAYANGGGYGPNTDLSGRTIDVQTYQASSPQGKRPAYDFNTHTLSADVKDAAGNVTTPATLIDTGTPLRKFVEPLRGVRNGLGGLPGQPSGIPVAIAEKWLNPLTGVQTTDDYIEIAIVEYTQQMHPDLPKETTLRGYVQIETQAIRDRALKDATGVIGSEHIPATYPDGTAIVDNQGNPVFWVHKPHYLGPVIVATKGTPVRLKFSNYLPYTTFDGVKVGSPRGGELMIPVDESIAGGGPIFGPGGETDIVNKFTQNRAGIHWHGGDTPWISDGTPHQWIAPAGDGAYQKGLGKGVSFQNVPDMPDPGEGSGTLYFPNNLSGRMMFYHDHTSGLTRLNVYMGEAAGYVVIDPVEQALVSRAMGIDHAAKVGDVPVGLLDTIGIPLVFQDKGFVPNNIGKVPQSQDLRWDQSDVKTDDTVLTTRWGQPGDLWFPHVYETNQDPNSIDGTNPTGRWDWGPWFWPVFPAQYSLPTGEYGDVTTTPEAFVDTPMINGQVYPTMEVEPKTYRFRVLNAANDRTINLSLFKAVDAKGVACDAANTAPAMATPMSNGYAPGELGALAACTEVKMVPATPTAGFPANWPVDGRAGGVPDPALAGPDIVQIGSEGGLLPTPAIWKAQPISYDTDKRSITILNVLNHGLQLGSAERADVLIDFSKYAGQTLIVYNDAPTPMPAVDPRTDYYTGMGDMTDFGGAYDVLPGYGPNTRTVMQIKVAAAKTSGGPLDTAALARNLPVAYAATQPAPIIPQKVYEAPFGTSYKDNYAGIFTGSLTKPMFSITTDGVTSVAVPAGLGGAGYSVAPLVSFTGGGGTGAEAVASIDASGTVTAITVTKPGTKYTTAPTVQLIPAAASTAPTAAASATALITKELPVINKAIQELFEPLHGRMNATLAAELPFSSATIATTIPLAYIDTPVEYLDAIKDGEMQVWKITHNGVDSHPVHLHLVNAQVINRVDWAGVIKPPQANEVGWKETIVMNPLEDVYLAVKASRPVTPFGLPTSSRVLDPAQALGTSLGFTQIDPETGQRPLHQMQLVGGVTTKVDISATKAYSNQETFFDNEYVWHCHILGHEENDFMRPFVFHPNVVRPNMPALVGIAGNTLTWADPTPFGGVDVDGVPTAGLAAGHTEPTNNPKNEIGFRVYKSTDGVTFNWLVNLPANVTKWTNAQVASTDLLTNYKVVAYNVAGESTSTAVAVTPLEAPMALNAPTAPGVPLAGAPTGLVQTPTGTAGTALTWDAVAGATGYVVTVGTGATAITQTVTTNSAQLATVAGGNVTVAAIVDGVTGAAANVFNGIAYRPVAFTVTQGRASTYARGSIALTWANNPLNAGNVTGLTLTWVPKDGGTIRSKTLPANSTGATLSGLSRDKDYNLTLRATGPFGDSTALTTMALTSP